MLGVRATSLDLRTLQRALPLQGLESGWAGDRLLLAQRQVASSQLFLWKDRVDTGIGPKDIFSPLDKNLS